MRTIIKKLLLQLAANIDAGNCNMTEEEFAQILDALKTMTEPYISKYEACQLLGVSRATFDNLVREGKLPRGKKRKGFKELAWNKHDINKFITNNNQHAVSRLQKD